MARGIIGKTFGGHAAGNTAVRNSMGRKRMGKKAQVTIFMVLGIIILIVGGVYLYTREEGISAAVRPGTEVQIEQVPSEFLPVQSFVEGCLGQAGKQGLKLIGEHGGFISLLENNIRTTPEPTESDAVAMAPGSSYSIPYWWYLASDNSCQDSCQFTMVPDAKLSLKKYPGKVSIEGQLEKYIGEKIGICLDSFKELRKQGFDIKEQGNPSARVTVARGQVQLFLTYPLLASRSGEKELKQFITALPIDLPVIYNAAESVAKIEAQLHFLERHTLNLLSGYGRLNPNFPPAFFEMRPGTSSPVLWTKSKVNKILTDYVLAPNIALLKVYGTRNYEPYPFPSGSLADSLYNSGMLVPGTFNWSNIDITIEYNPFWPIYFDLDCGDICGPETIADMAITRLILNIYRFVYKVSFPAKVTIFDPGAFNREGFTFTYFLEANIRNNRPMLTDYVGSAINNPVGASQLCNLNNRNSGEYTLEAKDSLTQNSLQDVQVTFTDGAETCLIGTITDGTLTTKLPIALDALLTFAKQGYLSSTQRVLPRLDQKEQLKAELAPILNKKFELRKQILQRSPDANYWTSGLTSPLDRQENGFVLLTRIGNQFEQQFSSGSDFLGNQTQLSDIQIAPGEYEVSISLFDDRNITIIDKNTILPEGPFTFSIGSGFRTGGALFKFNFTPYNIKKQNFTFLALNPDLHPIPVNERKVDDLTFIQEIDNQSNRYWFRLTEQLREVPEQ